MSILNNLTDEQKEIVYSNARDLMAIYAFAGTGKTSTLEAYAQFHKNKRMLYLAFNKSMSDSAAKKFKNYPNIVASSIHSLAYKNIGYRYASKLGEYMPSDLVNYVTYLESPKRIYAASLLIHCLNSYFSSATMNIPNFLEQVPRHIIFQLDKAGMTIPMAVASLNSIWNDIVGGKIKVSHNAYLKMYQLGPVNLGYDVLLVDEAQDLTDCVIDILLRQTAKKIFVGDPYQQIYGWNGAVNALQTIIRMGAEKFYLTRSFRCSHDVAAFANKYLKLLDNKKDFTGCLTQKISGELAVIARTNLSIFDFAAKECENHKIHYLGGIAGYDFEYLKDICFLMKENYANIRHKFIKKFTSYMELKDYAERMNDVTLKSRLKITDYYGHETVALCDKIVSLHEPQREKASVIVSTIHKSKGHEFGEVILLNDFVKIREIIAQTTFMKKAIDLRAEEIHLLYVAITRSLGMVNCPREFLIADSDIGMFKSLVGSGRIRIGH